jgi:hypothetical protein
MPCPAQTAVMCGPLASDAMNTTITTDTPLLITIA